MAEDEREDNITAEEPGWKRRQSGGVLLWTFIALLAGVFIGMWITYTALRGAPGNMEPPPGQGSTVTTGTSSAGFPVDFPLPDGTVLESKAATSGSGSDFIVRVGSEKSVKEIGKYYEGGVTGGWSLVNAGYSTGGDTPKEASIQLARGDVVAFVNIVARGSGSELRIAILGVEP
jgi:hypothetical protein